MPNRQARAATTHGKRSDDRLRKESGGRSTPPRKRRRRRLLSSDRLLALAGFGVAGCAAFLPWYAMNGGHGLGIRNDGQLRLSGHRDGMAGYGIGGSIRPFGRRTDDVAKAKARLDSLATGTIPGIGKPFDRARRGGRPDQPFPGRPFRLVHVANGQALIADDSGMYLVGRRLRAAGQEHPEGLHEAGRSAGRSSRPTATSSAPEQQRGSAVRRPQV